MSRTDGLRKLSAECVRVYPFKCGRAEVQDYVIKREIDERTKECYYVACYAFLRSSYLFLFSHDMARTCKQAVNLQRCVVRAFVPDKHWPSCSPTGYQIWPAGSGYTEAAASSATLESLPDTCLLVGCFNKSKGVDRALLAHTRRASNDAAIVAAAAAEDDDDEYYNNETEDGDSEDVELQGLWTYLSGLDSSQIERSSEKPKQQQQLYQDNSGSAGGGWATTPATKASTSSVAATAAKFLGPVAEATPPLPRSPKPLKPTPQPPVRSTPAVVGDRVVGGAGVGFRVGPLKPVAPPTSQLPQSQPQPSSLLEVSSGAAQKLPAPLTPQSAQAKSPEKPTLSPQPSLNWPPSQQSLPRDPQPATPLRSPITPTKDAKVSGPAMVSPKDPSMDPPVPPSKDLPVPPRDLPVPPRDLPVPPRDLPVPPRDLPVPPRDLPVPPRDPAVPTRDPIVPPRDLPVPTSTQSLPPPADLYEILIGARSIDSLCGYYCYGYYGQEIMSQARQLMKRASKEGSYMLRGFCVKQAGQEKILCIKYSTVYKLRILVVANGYQIGNDQNDLVHSSMEALIFYHHLHPIKVAHQIDEELILCKPYDFDGKWCSSKDYRTNALTAALWNHGSKEQCAETLKNSEDGTYAVRADLQASCLVLCVTHKTQIVKFRIKVITSETRREFMLDHSATMPRFNSLEELLVHHHKQAIRGSAADGEILLRMPFQLVKRCQEELDFQQLTLEGVFTSDSVENAKLKVARLKSGNFLLRKATPNSGVEDDGNGGKRVAHSLIVREDTGGSSVRVFRILERDTDLSFRPKTIFTLEEKPELVTNRIEKIIHYLCSTTRYLSPDIICLVKP